MGKSQYSSEQMQRYFNDPEFRRKQIRRKAKHFSTRSLVLMLAGLLVAVSLATWYLFYILEGLPSLEALENPSPELATKVIAADGDILDQLQYKNRSRVSIDSLPPGLVAGLVATEDKEFYNHWGLHVTRIFKAMVKNILALDIDREGASTITQQLSLNLHLKHRGTSLFDKVTRKLREAVTSIQIERNFTKDEIIELYLNTVYFGRSAYGIESAAQTYFNKSASELDLPEYALLIAMLKGPGYYDPVNRPERALERRNLVIRQMVNDGVLDPDTAAVVMADSIRIEMTSSEFRKGIAPHFVEWIRQDMQKKGEEMGFDVYRDGLRIYSTIDSRMQRHAIQAIEDHLPWLQGLFDSTWDWREHPDILQDNLEQAIRDTDGYKRARNTLERDSVVHVLMTDTTFINTVKRRTQQIEVGFVALDPHTGHILALVGGRQYRNYRYGLNHVTQMRRQPGSAFKPFVYTVALDNGYPPCYELLNQPVTIPMPDGTRWTPQNFDLSVGGKYTLREAVQMSINLITVRAILEIAPPKQVAEYANRMGILSRIPPYESIALGSVEVSPLDIASAYGVFANEGVAVPPFPVIRIEDKDGNVLEQNSPERREVLSKETAYIMTDLLRGVVNGGTATRAIRTFYNGPAAGKTGTTNDFGDAWFVGFTPRIVAAIWVGFDDGRIKFRSADGQGGRAAAPVWGRFMKYVYEDPDIDMPLERFIQPEGVATDTICVETKKKATPYCPETTTEIFNAKYPLSVCEKHASPAWNQGEGEIRKRSKISW